MEGIIPLWKPRGMTSHDCVFQLRKILKTKKVGHSGTLDPDVDGILPICIGKATKVVEYLQDSNKIYTGEITLGFSTETEDASGEVVEVTPVISPVSDEEIDEAMTQLTGKIKQVPPMYSAVKVNGRRLYDYARNGETVERPIRDANIYSYRRLSESVYNEVKQTQSWRFEVDCGKGTYVRTLSVDTGKKLGFAAHMSDLTRLASGGFSASEAVSLDMVRMCAEADTLDQVLYPLERALSSFKRIDLSEQDYSVIKNGSVVPHTFFKEQVKGEIVALYYQDKAVSLYAEHPSKVGYLKPMKVLRND